MDRIAYDWTLNALKVLPSSNLVTNRSGMAYQFPRKCALTSGLFKTNAHKYTLVPVRDAVGARVAYINAHSVSCREPKTPNAANGTRRSLVKATHQQRADGCAGATIQLGPEVAHYGFTKVTVPMMERKLQTYRDLYAAEGKLSSKDAVAHYSKLRNNFEWCGITKSFQFTAAARALANREFCEPLPPHVAADYPEVTYCPGPPTVAPSFKPTKRPTPRPTLTNYPTSTRKPTKRPTPRPTLTNSPTFSRKPTKRPTPRPSRKAGP